MDENHSAGSEIQRPQYGRRSWPGSEPSALVIDVYIRRYVLLVVLARNDDDDKDNTGNRKINKYWPINIWSSQLALYNSYINQCDLDFY